MQSRLPYLDSSRGLAALIVLIAHFQLALLPFISQSVISFTPLNFLFDGESAVLYFFLLSGYVLTLSVKRSGTFGLHSYGKFLFRRILRIYPAFIVALIFTFIILKFIPANTDGWIGQFWKPGYTPVDILKQSLLITRIPAEPVLRLLPHDWTLSIEISVSLMLPLIAAASSVNAFVSLIIIYLSVQFLKLDSFTFDFALGIYIASNQEKLIPLIQSRRRAFILVCAAIVFISLQYLFPQQFNRSDLILLHHKTYPLAVFLLVLISSAKLQRLFSITPLIFLGKISYSFYLFHLVLLLLVITLINLPVMLTFSIYLLICIVVSGISYCFIERPFMNIRVENLKQTTRQSKA